MARAIRAGRAEVEIFADTTALARGLRSASKKLIAFGTSVTNIGRRIMMAGAAAGAPFLGATKVFSSMGDQLGKMAKRTGFSVESLSELDYAATLSGASLEDFETTVKRMQRSVVDAASGSKDAVDSFKYLGLSIRDLSGLAPEKQFELIADRLSQIKDPTIKAGLAMKLFGRSGTDLLPMLNEGSRGIASLREEARRFGLTVSTADATAAELFTDKMTTLWKVLKKLVFVVGASVAPAIKSFVERLTEAVAAAGQWIDDHRGLVSSMFRLTGMVLGVGAALTVLGFVITGIGKTLGIFSLAVNVASASVGVISSLILGMVTPIGLTVASLVGLGGYLLWALDTGQKALGELGEEFSAMKDEAVASCRGIGDALAAGDISLAAKVLWLSLRLEWTRGINFLEKAWLDFRDFFVRVGYDAWRNLLFSAETVWHGLEVGWIETTSFLSETWVLFTSSVVKAWHWAGKKLAELWNWLKGLFDEKFDVEAANAAAEEYYQTRKAEIEAEAGRKISGREEQRKRERRRAAAAHEATMLQLKGENLQRHRELDAEYERRMAENEADLAKARAEWGAGLGTAREARTRRERESKAAKPPARPNLGDVVSTLEDLFRISEKAESRFGAAGTFLGRPSQLIVPSGKSVPEKLDRIIGKLDEVRKAVEKSGPPRAV